MRERIFCNLSGSFDERHVFSAEIPIYSNHVQIEL